MPGFQHPNRACSAGDDLAIDFDHDLCTGRDEPGWLWTVPAGTLVGTCWIGLRR
jgi:hypothetical protein